MSRSAWMLSAVTRCLTRAATGRTGRAVIAVVTVVTVALASGACDDATAPAPTAAPPRPSLRVVSIGTPVELGTLPGGGESEAFRVNNLGHAAGWARNSAGQLRAVIWTAPGQLADLGTLPGGTQSWALGISDVIAQCPLICPSMPPGSIEYVVGRSDRLLTFRLPFGKTISVTVQHAFRWDAQNGMIDLGTLGGETSSGFSVVGDGSVLGESFTAAGELHAFLWTPAGGMQDLGTLGANGFSRGFDLGASGAAGTAGGGTVWMHAVRWASSGKLQDLGTLPGGTWSAGYGINASGWVAGGAQTSASTEHAVLWTAPGQPLDLGVTSTATVSEAEAVNDAGWVVGYLWGPGIYSGFLWTDSDGMAVLPDLPGKSIGWANDINGGFIVGGLGSGISTMSAVMWTASQPEPPAACLICPP